MIYVNDMPDGLSSYINMFADDAKIMKEIINVNSCIALQKDLDRLYNWSQTWKMQFNAKKMPCT